MKMDFAELQKKILNHKAKSEYKQAAIVILRDIFSNPKETETVHGNEAEKEGIILKYCATCKTNTWHDQYGCLNDG